MDPNAIASATKFALLKLQFQELKQKLDEALAVNASLQSQLDAAKAQEVSVPQSVSVSESKAGPSEYVHISSEQQTDADYIFVSSAVCPRCAEVSFKASQQPSNDSDDPVDSSAEALLKYRMNILLKTAHSACPSLPSAPHSELASLRSSWQFCREFFVFLNKRPGHLLLFSHSASFVFAAVSSEDARPATVHFNFNDVLAVAAVPSGIKGVVSLRLLVRPSSTSRGPLPPDTTGSLRPPRRSPTSEESDSDSDPPEESNIFTNDFPTPMTPAVPTDEQQSLDSENEMKVADDIAAATESPIPSPLGERKDSNSPASAPEIAFTELNFWGFPNSESDCHFVIDLVSTSVLSNGQSSADTPVISADETPHHFPQSLQQHHDQSASKTDVHSETKSLHPDPARSGFYDLPLNNELADMSSGLNSNMVPFPPDMPKLQTRVVPVEIYEHERYFSAALGWSGHFLLPTDPPRLSDFSGTEKRTRESVLRAFGGLEWSWVSEWDIDSRVLAVVDHVAPTGPAAKAGIQPRDLILRLLTASQLASGPGSGPHLSEADHNDTPVQAYKWFQKTLRQNVLQPVRLLIYRPSWRALVYSFIVPAPVHDGVSIGCKFVPSNELSLLQGWEYAPYFYRNGNGQYSLLHQPTSFVRRRRWVRLARVTAPPHVLDAFTRPIPADSVGLKAGRASRFCGPTFGPGAVAARGKPFSNPFAEDYRSVLEHSDALLKQAANPASSILAGAVSGVTGVINSASNTAKAIGSYAYGSSESGNSNDPNALPAELLPALVAHQGPGNPLHPEDFEPWELLEPLSPHDIPAAPFDGVVSPTATRNRPSDSKLPLPDEHSEAMRPATYEPEVTVHGSAPSIISNWHAHDAPFTTPHLADSPAPPVVSDATSNPFMRPAVSVAGTTRRIVPGPPPPGPVPAANRNKKPPTQQQE